MPNPDALWQDIQKLDDMYEELMWHPDDELQFTHDGEKIIIYNKTKENTKKSQKNKILCQNSLHMLEGSFFMPKNQVSVEELRCRVMKLKNGAYFDTIPIAEGSDKKRHLYPGEQQLVQRHLNYVLDMLQEYRYQGLTDTENRSIIHNVERYET